MTNATVNTYVAPTESYIKLTVNKKFKTVSSLNTSEKEIVAAVYVALITALSEALEGHPQDDINEKLENPETWEMLEENLIAKSKTVTPEVMQEAFPLLKDIVMDVLCY